jgi:hypothetical protein
MAKDILLDTDRDLLLKNGDLVFDEADSQNIETLVILNQGDLKDNPLVGCNSFKLINGKVDPTAVKRAISIQLTGDGFQDQEISFNGAELYVSAVRK